MHISCSSWHLKVYWWWFEKRKGYRPYLTQVNLCPYVRAVLLWAPLSLLFRNWVKLYKWKSGRYVSLNMVTIPVAMYVVPKLMGYLSYNAKMMLFVFEAIAMFSVLMAVILTGIAKLIVNGVKWSKEKGDYWEKPLKFGELLIVYVKSIHDKVCPQIDIRD